MLHRGYESEKGACMRREGEIDRETDMQANRDRLKMKREHIGYRRRTRIIKAK